VASTSGSEPGGVISYYIIWFTYLMLCMVGAVERYSATCKAKVLEAATEMWAIAALPNTFQVYPVKIDPWKKQLSDEIRSSRRASHRRPQG
jgi:hypothetical protein